MSSPELVTSYYNFFVPRNDGFVVYNAAKGSFVFVDKPVGRALRAKKVPELPEEYLSKLCRAGILENGTQRDRLLAAFDLQKYGAKHIGFTIAPTIECNYACWYCYQNERRHLGVMSTQIQASVVDFIESATDCADTFHLNWFGGEPLLALDVIEDLSEKVAKRFSSKNAKQLGSSIITNGILLNEQNVARLLSVGIDSAQVSIDALYHKPPTERGLLNSDGSPSPILANVLKFKDVLSINIRVNVSQTVEVHRDAMETVLAEAGLSQNVHYARVEDNKSECSSQRPVVTKGMIRRKAYARVKRTAVKDPTRFLEMAQDALRPRSHFCGATDGSLFVIDFRGDVSRCFFSAGVADESIGNVQTLRRGRSDSNFITDSKIERQWSEYSPATDDLGCRTCRVLPLCMGGCAHSRILKGAETPPCEQIKYNINQFVSEIGRRINIQ